MSFDITQCHELTVPKLSQSSAIDSLQAHLSGDGIVRSRHTAVFSLQQPRRGQSLYVLMHALVVAPEPLRERLHGGCRFSVHVLKQLQSLGCQRVEHRRQIWESHMPLPDL